MTRKPLTRERAKSRPRGTTKVERRCQACDKPFMFVLSQLNHYPGGGKYYSRACHFLNPRTCVVCGEGFQGAEDSRYCSPKCSARAYTLLGPIERKAWSMGANVLGGPGKRTKMEALLRAALGTPCLYCRTVLTLENVGLDHMTPIGQDLRTNKAENVDARRVADAWDNLQLICRSCNAVKGDMTHLEFIELLGCVAAWDDKGEALFSRLRMAGWAWSQKRKSA